MSHIPYFYQMRIWNQIEKNTEKRIRIHPFSMHIKNGHGYRYHITSFRGYKCWITQISIFMYGILLQHTDTFASYNCWRKINWHFKFVHIVINLHFKTQNQKVYFCNQTNGIKECALYVFLTQSYDILGPKGMDRTLLNLST